MPEPVDRNGLLAELLRRGVVQAVALYVAIAWGGTEILITVSDRFGWPGWIADAALILFLTGLPFVVVLAWAFDLNGVALRRVDPGSMRGKILIAGAATVTIATTASLVVLRDRDVEVDALQEPVIAILPIQDFSGKDGGALTALSFTGELIHRISAHPDLMALDLRSVTSPAISSVEIGGGIDRLRADYVVQGSLNPARGGTLLRVRMTDQGGRVLWEEETARNLDDAIEARVAQADVAGRIAAALGRTLTGIDYCEPSADAEAVAHYYEGWRRFSERSSQGVADAARALEAAVARDPDYARALSDLAVVYRRFYFWLKDDPSPYFDDRQSFEGFMDNIDATVLQLAERALVRCPSLGAAYASYETSQPVRLSINELMEIYEEALRREPDNVSLLNQAVNIAGPNGHSAAALEFSRVAYRKDPLNPRAVHLYASQLMARGQFAKAIDTELDARQLGYSAFVSNNFLAQMYIAMDDAERLEQHTNEAYAGDFVPSNYMPIHPRRLLDARHDASVRQAVIAELDALLPTLDGTDTERVLRWAKLLDDERLFWSFLAHFMTVRHDRGDTWMMTHVWDAAWRARIASDRLLELTGWGEQWASYWEEYGPPDDCTWDDGHLDCA